MFRTRFPLALLVALSPVLRCVWAIGDDSADRRHGNGQPGRDHWGECHAGRVRSAERIGGREPKAQVRGEPR